MISQHDKHRPSVLYNFQFLGTATIGSLTFSLVCSFAPSDTHLPALGVLVSILGGLLVSYISQEAIREKRREQMLSQLSVPIDLAADEALFDLYTLLCRRLIAIGQQRDDVLREFSLLKLRVIDDELELLGRGEVLFQTTESWRIVYERLLTNGITQYRSVAWIKSADYWQDQPGRNSMELNFRMRKSGLRIERIAIIRDSLWPLESDVLVEPVRRWLEHQEEAGIRIGMLRESELASEQDLLCDLGIYGSTAVGIQSLDENSRTTQFRLLFDSTDVSLFNDRWARLKLFSRPLEQADI